MKSLVVLLAIATPMFMQSCAGNGTKTREMDWVYAGIRPPAEYEVWWHETEDCLGLRYEFDRVTWLVAKGRTFSMGPLDSLVGYTLGNPRGMTIVLSQHYWLVPEVVRHEAVHAITGRGHGDIDERAFACAEKEVGDASSNPGVRGGGAGWAHHLRPDPPRPEVHQVAGRSGGLAVHVRADRPVGADRRGAPEDGGRRESVVE